MARYIDEKDVYALVEPHGTAKVHCAQIDELPRADVVPRAELSILTVQNMALEHAKCELQHELNKYKGVKNILDENMAELITAAIDNAKKEIDTLKSLITQKEEEAYNKGYEDAKADILEKLQAEVERAETIAKYGDDFYEGKAEGVNAAMNCILSEGEQ